MNTVFPLGYSTPGAQERIEELLSSQNTLLIDTRIKPYSWNELWRKEALEQKYGNKYRWAGKVLGNKALGTGRIEIADIDTGIRGLVRYLHEGYDLILLCQCKEYDKCHVSHIVRHLREMPDVEVVRFEQEEMQQQLFDVPRTAPEQVEMSTSSIQEWRYSVSDVIFQDVGDMLVPPEHQALFDEYCAEIDILPVETPMWRSATPEYKNVLLEKSRHKAYTRSLLCSGDSKAMRAAQEAMLNQLDRYYESQQQKEHVEECRKNLLKARQEGRKWTKPQR